MRILVTGGAGFIGSHLIRRLLDGNNEVVVIDNFNDYYSPEIKRSNIKEYMDDKRFKLIEDDIRSDLKSVFEQESIDQVIHLAARAGVRPSLVDPVLYHDVNVQGTLNLLECCKEFGIKKFIFGSSSSVYGVNKKTPFSENDSLDNPISPYAVTKIAGEQLSKIYNECFGINIICLRFFTVYGPSQRPEMAIHKFTRMINEGKPIPFYGDGESGRDYTYIDDIIDGIVSCIDKDFKYEIVNLGDSRVVKLKEMVNIIETVLGKKAKLDQMSMQKGDVPITYADISKAKKLLGYEPKVKIEDGIKHFVTWFKKTIH